MRLKLKEADIEKRDKFRKQITDFEGTIAEHPDAQVGDCCPLKHTFADGMYIREITMPAGMFISSKIHKTSHPYFITKGDVTVVTEDGPVRIKAPYSGITPAGTKRALFTHEETVWTTIHLNPDNTEDLEVIEGRVIAKDFKELDSEVHEWLS